MVSLFVLALASSGCDSDPPSASQGTDSQVDEAIQRAEKAAAHFHALMNQGKYRDIYVTAHSSFKEVTPETTFVPTLERSHQQLGDHKASRRTGEEVQRQGSMAAVTLIMESEFANGVREEQFAYVLTPSTSELQMYRVAPTGARARQDRVLAAITEFHQRMHTHQHPQIYAAMHPDFRQKTSEAALTRVLEQLDHQLGAYQRASDIQSTVDHPEAPTRMTLRMSAHYEHGNAKEYFDLDLTDSKITLRSFEINAE